MYFDEIVLGPLVDRHYKLDQKLNHVLVISEYEVAFGVDGVVRVVRRLPLDMKDHVAIVEFGDGRTCRNEWMKKTR